MNNRSVVPGFSAHRYQKGIADIARFLRVRGQPYQHQGCSGIRKNASLQRLFHDAPPNDSGSSLLES